MSDFSDNHRGMLAAFHDAAADLQTALRGMADNEEYTRESRLFAVELFERLQKLRVELSYL